MDQTNKSSSARKKNDKINDDFDKTEWVTLTGRRYQSVPLIIAQR